MAILFGFGRHAINTLKRYRVPQETIVAVVDNTVYKEQCQVENLNILSWEQFLENSKQYNSQEIVVGTAKGEKFEEIRNTILSSYLFAEESILWIDDWIQQFPLTADDMVFEKLIMQFEEKRTHQMIYSAKSISKEAVVGAQCLANREEMLKRLPHGLMCAEVGVAYGDFSRKILDCALPKKFYAIDLFSENIPGFWDSNLFQDSNMQFYDYYKARFQKEIFEKIVEMKKGYSWDVLSNFSDDFFDYVYLDAAHDYSSVKKDIAQLEKKVKNGGIIQFNDYTYQEDYGVIPAVNEFLGRTSSKVLFYCFAANGYADVVIKLNK